MFGTIFRMRPKAGQQQAVEDLFHSWGHERQHKVEGAFAGYLFKSTTHPGELVGVAVFDSKSAYLKNADDPEQDAWYRELRSHLDSDPEWNDGEVDAVGQPHEY